MTRHVTSELSAHSVSQMCSYDGGFLHDWEGGRRGRRGREREMEGVERKR